LRPGFFAKRENASAICLRAADVSASILMDAIYDAVEAMGNWKSI
jgi:hypothetical protein